MRVTFKKSPSGFISLQSDDAIGRVLGEFLTTDVAHMPSVVRELIMKGEDEQVIMDACRMHTKGDIAEITHLYLENLPVFKASKEALLAYVAQWESFLRANGDALELNDAL
ncbi:MAG: hypothetical protein WD068_00030 [Candidatus Babeliales bacterium]